MSSERVSFSVNDDELAEFLDSVENKSEVMRSALRREMYQEAAVEDERLTDDQRQAYEWFRRYAGVGEPVDVGVAKTVLAQQLSLKKELVKLTVLRPLERLGYVSVGWYGMESVKVLVEVPPGVSGQSGVASGSSEGADVGEDGVAGSLGVDDPAEAGERLDELVAAQEEVAAGD